MGHEMTRDHGKYQSAIVTDVFSRLKRIEQMSHHRIVAQLLFSRSRAIIFVAHRGLLSGMGRVQPVESCGQKALLPATDGRRGGSQPQFDETVRSASGQQQDQPGAKDMLGEQRSGLGNPAEFQTLVSERTTMSLVTYG